MDKALRLIGLARRGGNAAVGEEPVSCAARAGRAKAVLLASDASERTARRARATAEDGHAEFLALPYTREELGNSVGRASCAILALLDAGLARAVQNALRDGRESSKRT